jgi:hypothetical protein
MRWARTRRRREQRDLRIEVFGMSAGVIMLLRVLHIVGGAFWVGAAVFIAVFLGPSLRAVGPAGGAVMSQLTQVRRLPIWMMVAMSITLIAGFVLYWANARAGGSAWLGSGPGRAFGLGGLLAVAGGVVGMAVTAPTGRKLGALGAAMAAAGRPPTPEELATMQSLQRRMTTAATLVAVLVLLATVAMAVARYAR